MRILRFLYLVYFYIRAKNRVESEFKMSLFKAIDVCWFLSSKNMYSAFMKLFANPYKGVDTGIRFRN